MSARRRTGAGMAWNPDSIQLWWVEVVLLSAAVFALGIASIDGLLHYAERIIAPDLRWTLPVGVDIFLVGTALATLSLRRRGAYVAAIFCTVVTVGLVAFSAACNYMVVAAAAPPAQSLADEAAPFVKAAMPVLLLAAIEIVAALTSTKNTRAAKAAAKVARGKARAKAKARRQSARRTAQPAEVTP